MRRGSISDRLVIGKLIQKDQKAVLTIFLTSVAAIA